MILGGFTFMLVKLEWLHFLEHFKYNSCQIGALALKTSSLINHGSFKCNACQIGALVLKASLLISHGSF